MNALYPDCGGRDFEFYAEPNGKGWVKCEGGRPILYTKTQVRSLHWTGRTFVRIQVSYTLV